MDAEATDGDLVLGEGRGRPCLKYKLVGSLVHKHTRLGFVGYRKKQEMYRAQLLQSGTCLLGVKEHTSLFTRFTVNGF